MKAVLRTSVLFVSLLAAALLHAQQAVESSKTFGGYTVHYNAVNSTFLNPTIAKQYDITRGDRNAFINITVLRNEKSGSTTPVTATLHVQKNTLLGESSEIPCKEIREGEAIYYICQFVFSNAETMRFVADVQPEGKGQSQKIEWSTTLYSK